MDHFQAIFQVKKQQLPNESNMFQRSSKVKNRLEVLDIEKKTQQPVEEGTVGGYSTHPTQICQPGNLSQMRMKL